MKPKLIILGAGFAGAALAVLAKEQFRVTVIEGSNQVGGGNLTRVISGHPYTYGPRIFFSDDEAAIKFAEQYLNIRQFYTRSITFVDRIGEFLSYPLQYEEINRIGDYSQEPKPAYDGPNEFESYWKHYLGQQLYTDVVDKYSKKMWNIESNRQLTLNWNWVNKGSPIRSGDKRLYGDMFQGYPKNLDGYNPFFQHAFTGTELILGSKVTNIDVANRTVQFLGNHVHYDKLAIAIPLDEIFSFAFGELKYAGRHFIPLILPIAQALPDDITWVHYAGDEPYTRVTEFKKITGFNHYSQTLIGIEIPSQTGRFYPVQSEVELLRYSKYHSLLDKNVFCMGRHGTFKYKGIPDVIRDAINIWDQLK
jgi:UDP-galactopyranose mutase